MGKIIDRRSIEIFVRAFDVSSERAAEIDDGGDAVASG